MVEGAAEDRSLNFWVRFQVEVLRGTIRKVRFRAYGCPHSLAAADLIASELEGRPSDALVNIDLAGLARQLALPREKQGLLLRIEDALAASHAALVSRD